MDKPTDKPRHAAAARYVVVAPTYDNVRTLRGVLDAVALLGLPIIVTNDGSRDATADVLAAWASDGVGDRLVVTHGTNRGKAAALRSGFDAAAARGFTHAITIDTDGQHDPADVSAMLRASAQHATAIVLGTRSTEGVDYPIRSRVGRVCSNVLVSLIGGIRVSDSQCGLRVYPLDVVRRLGARTGRYAFETEVLARAGWANIDVVEVTVRCIYALPSGRVTHFRPWRDSLSAATMHLRLLARSLAFWPPAKLRPIDDATTSGTLVERVVRWMNPFRTWRLIRSDEGERERFAAAAGVGALIGVLPLFGLKTVVCLGIARTFRFSPLVVIGTSSCLTTPPAGFVVSLVSVAFGNLVLHGTLPERAQYDVATLGAGQVFRSLAAEWIVGALLLGTATGGATWILARAFVGRLRVDRAADRVSLRQGRRLFSERTLGDPS